MNCHLGGVGLVEWEEDEGSDWCRSDVAGSYRRVGVTLSHVQRRKLAEIVIYIAVHVNGTRELFFIKVQRYS